MRSIWSWLCAPNLSLRVLFKAPLLLPLFFASGCKTDGEIEGFSGEALVQFESASLGTGTVLTSVQLQVGQTLQVYSILRDRSGKFEKNLSVSWSLAATGIGSLTVGTSGDSAVYSATSVGTDTVIVTFKGKTYRLAMNVVSNSSGNAQCTANPGASSYLDIGAGTLASPYIICNTTQFNDIGLSGCGLASKVACRKHFQLGNHLDFNGVSLQTIGYLHTKSATGANSWDDDNVFGGVFDGANFELRNITFTNASYNFAAIFEATFDTSMIKRLRITGLNITGNTRVAGLVGLNRGYIDDVQVTGNVTGNSYVGCLAGVHELGADTNVAITNSTGNCQIFANFAVGGLVGYAAAKISDSTAAGLITASDPTKGFQGGFAGYVQNTQILSCSTSVAIVGGGASIGGFAGAVVSSTIRYSRSTGNIESLYSGGSFHLQGGFIGNLRNASVIEFNSSSGQVKAAKGGSVGGFAGVIGYTGDTTYPTVRFNYTLSSILITTNQSAAGFAGHAYSVAVVEDNYAKNSITTTGGGSVSGFIGVQFSSGVKRNYTVSQVTGAATIYGFKGSTGGDTSSANNFWDTTVSATANHGPAGGDLSGIYEGKTTANLKTQSTLQTAGWDFTSVWQMGTDGYPALRSNAQP